jgi:hypothetical protein
MAYELADYYGGGRTLTAEHKAALLAGAAAKRAKAKVQAPPPWYSILTERKSKRCRPLKANPERTQYNKCRLEEWHNVPCKYRTKENAKQLKVWAQEHCPKTKRMPNPSLPRIKQEAKALGIRLTRINEKGKRVAKTKRMLIAEIGKSYGS